MQANLAAIIRKPYLASMFRLLTLCAVALSAFVLRPAFADEDDLETARERYEECFQLMEDRKPCRALVACKAGLKAKDLSILKSLTAKANRGCEQEKQSRVPVCEAGQSLVDGKHCCWPGQIWGLPAGSEDAMCLGKPTSCPPGLVADAFFQTCRRETCEGSEKIKTADGHCCWEGQSWNPAYDVCWGYPHCPEFHTAQTEQAQHPALGPYEAYECTISDFDKDGIPDSDDISCPRAAEDNDGFQDEDGCPDPDNDKDGLCDPNLPSEGSLDRYCKGEDLCPGDDSESIKTAEDTDSFQDADGCPDLDNDSDTIIDTFDRCPGTDRDVLQGVNTSEDFDNYEDTDGCPDISAEELAALQPKRDRTWQIVGWSSVGTGIALIGTGVGLEVWANDMRNEVLDPAQSSGPVIQSINQNEVPDLEKRANTVGGIGLACWVSGAALTATGAAFVIYDFIFEPTEAAPLSEQPQLSGQIGPDHWMMTLSGRF